MDLKEVELETDKLAHYENQCQASVGVGGGSSSNNLVYA
jgi:hypothetical protein